MAASEPDSRRRVAGVVLLGVAGVATVMGLLGLVGEGPSSTSAAPPVLSPEASPGSTSSTSPVPASPPGAAQPGANPTVGTPIVPGAVLGAGASGGGAPSGGPPGGGPPNGGPPGAGAPGAGAPGGLPPGAGPGPGSVGDAPGGALGTVPGPGLVVGAPLGPSRGPGQGSPGAASADGLLSGPGPVPRAALSGPLDVSALSVRVYNNSMIIGLARRAAKELRLRAWNVVEVGNYPYGVIPESTVYFRPGTEEEGAAHTLAAQFGVRALPRFEGIRNASPGLIVITTNNWGANVN